MNNYTETEVALKELFQNIKTVPGTFPPVYTCNGFVIGYNRQGQLTILGAPKSEPEPDSGWLTRWANRGELVAKMVMITASLGMLLIGLQSF